MAVLPATPRRWEYLLPVTSILPQRTQVPSASTVGELTEKSDYLQSVVQSNSPDILIQQSDVADDDAVVMEEGQWTYRVSEKLSARFDLRAWPAPKASKTGAFVHQGEVVVADARLVLDGILYLHVTTTTLDGDLASCEGPARTQSAGRGGWIFDRTQGGGSGICSAPGAHVLLHELPGGITHRVKLVGGRRTANCSSDPIAVARSVHLIHGVCGTRP
jgi:hypothetical protein